MDGAMLWWPPDEEGGCGWRSRVRLLWSEMKHLARRVAHFDLQVILAVPIGLVITVLLVLEGCMYLLVRVTGRLVEKWSNRRTVRRCIHQLRNAANFEAYSAVAERLDQVTGRDRWKFNDDPPTCGGSAEYDAILIRRKLEELRACRAAQDVPGLAMGIKTCLENHLCYTLRPELYSMTYAGTKRLAEDLHQELRECINLLTDLFIQDTGSIQESLPPESLDYLAHCARAFGSTGLVLSGGAMLGLHHFGLLEALIQMKRLPKIISGTSAGSVAAAFVCTRTEEEVLNQIRDLKKMEVFASPFEPNNWWSRFLHFFRHGHTVDFDTWVRKMSFLFGDMTFLEAYQRTGRALNITASRAGKIGGSIVLNYRNAPNILIATAVLASSAFPYLGRPILLIEKDPKTRLVSVSEEYSDRFYHDGSLRGDVPSTALRSSWNVKYVVVSQVNLHVFPFLELRTHGTPGLPVRGWSSATVWRGGFLLGLFEVLLKEHLRFLLRVLALSEIVPTVNGINMANVALQSYGGDLNVYPSRIAWPHAFFMNNVPPKLLGWFIHVGRQMIFPKMWILKTRMDIEAGVQKLEREVRRRLNDSQVTG